MMMSKIRKAQCPDSVDHDFDWLEKKDLPQDLAPLHHWEELTQPDDCGDLVLDEKPASMCFFFRRSRKKRQTDLGDVIGGTE